MTIFRCIQAALDTTDANGQPLMDAGRGRQAQELFTELRERYARTMSAGDADAAASADTKRILTERIHQRRRQVARDIQAKRDIYFAVTTHTDNSGRADPGEALPQLLQHSGSARFQDVRSTATAVRRRLFFGLEQFMGRHSKNLLGQTRNRAGLVNVAKEIMGEASGDAQASQLARALSDAYEEARLLFNAQGGNIPKLDGWMPQVWNPKFFTADARDEWVDQVFDALDWDKVVNPVTGQPFGAGNGSRQFLEAAYLTIQTRGTNKLEPSFANNGTALANQRQEERILHFKDAESWTAVAERWGSPDLFDASVGYLQTMARDIGTMTVLGRNPEATVEYAIQVAQKAALGDERATRRINSRANEARNMLFHHSGKGSIAQNEFMANFFSGTRNVLSSAYLGGAVISSVSDASTLGVSARHLGIPARRVFSRSFQNLISNASKEDMRRMLGILETQMETSGAMQRYMLDATGPEVTRSLASFVIRAQGLAHLTDINRASLPIEIMGEMQSLRDVEFDALPDSVKQSMQFSGIRAQEWDIFRAGEPFTARSGGEFLVVRDVLDREDLTPEVRTDIFNKFQGMLDRETDHAIPTNDLRQEARFLQSTQRGTVTGEAARGFLQFKGFPLHLMANMHRRFSAIPTAGGKIGYLATMMASMTVMGALALQLKDLVKGNEPRDMSTDEFWAQAMLQGGALGIFGDFVANETNRYGGSLAESIMGPQVGLASDLIDLTAGNILQEYQGRDSRFTKEAVELVRRTLPGSNLWQTRLVLERMVFDQIQLALDPQSSEDFARRERSRYDATGSGSWWAPGDFLP